jgi:ribonuclease HI|tara:strand:- start:2027 stop:2470 length:444 start_codon:yes stop_codon:yes gene_type:complete
LIEVYTDGSCLGNPGKGGWAFLVNNEGVISSRSGYSIKATNNQMELTAAIKAIEFLVNHKEMSIYTDSNYLKNGITLWVTNWKKNNWKTASKNPVKNKELWERLDQLNYLKKIKWKWVKAHDTNKLNNEVDLLARQSAETLTESSFN